MRSDIPVIHVQSLPNSCIYLTLSTLPGLARFREMSPAAADRPGKKDRTTTEMPPKTHSFASSPLALAFLKRFLAKLSWKEGGKGERLRGERDGEGEVIWRRPESLLTRTILALQRHFYS